MDVIPPNEHAVPSSVRALFIIEMQRLRKAVFAMKQVI
jgi:hypothetical protein